jgi:hypothetical protein
MILLLCAGCRDYIHIMDLAVGHVAALKQILNPDFKGIKVPMYIYLEIKVFVLYRDIISEF